MRRRFEKLTVAVLLATSVLTGFGGADLHSHAGVAPVHSGAAWTTHACGDREIHVPLEEFSRCVLCLAGLSRSAILQPDHAVPPAAGAILDHPLPFPPLPGSVDLSSSGKRGPPLS